MTEQRERGGDLGERMRMYFGERMRRRLREGQNSLDHAGSKPKISQSSITPSFHRCKTKLTQPRGEAKDLVERERQEVGADSGQVQGAGGHEGRGVQHDEPAALQPLLEAQPSIPGLLHPPQGVLPETDGLPLVT